MADQEQEEKRKNIKVAILKRVLPFLVFAILGGVATYAVAREKPQILGLAKNNEQTQKEVDTLLGEVGKLIALPTDEKPTVATVSDAEKIKEQAFFKSAQNGDKVLIYTNARKVILYRPSNKQIIDVGAVNIQQKKPEVAGEGIELESPKPSSAPLE